MKKKYGKCESEMIKAYKKGELTSMAPSKAELNQFHSMRACVVKKGNSQGIRIPKPLLDQTGIMDDVELEVEKNQIIIRPISNPRPGWDSAFRTMAKNAHDTLIDGNDTISNSWDDEEWQW